MFRVLEQAAKPFQDPKPSVDGYGAAAHDGAGGAADQDDGDGDGHVVGHGVGPAG